MNREALIIHFQYVLLMFVNTSEEDPVELMTYLVNIFSKGIALGPSRECQSTSYVLVL